MRYIDADELDNIIAGVNSKGWGITRNEYKKVESILLEFPTADVRENVKGEWVDKEGVPRCSNCNTAAPFAICGYMWHAQDFERVLSNFCPNCGADMRGDANDI